MSLLATVSRVQCKLESGVHIWIVSGPEAAGPLGFNAQPLPIVYFGRCYRSSPQKRFRGFLLSMVEEMAAWYSIPLAEDEGWHHWSLCAFYMTDKSLSPLNGAGQ